MTPQARLWFNIAHMAQAPVPCAVSHERAARAAARTRRNLAAVMRNVMLQRKLSTLFRKAYNAAR